MRVSTGIDGLDYLLRGGLLPGRVYLIHGGPGTGKTTLGLHFLAAGEGGLMVSFAQSAAQIRADAETLGLNIGHVKILDLAPSPDIFAEAQTYDIFLPAEVERDPISHEIKQTIDEMNPTRVFVDGFGHFRNLVSDTFQYQRLTQSFFRYATRRGATLLVGSEESECAQDVDGVIHLDTSNLARTIQVTKFRGSDFHPGPQPMRLTGTGLQVFLSAA
jgi:circadian clock protein KaiC